jgi:hypothetical protein
MKRTSARMPTPFRKLSVSTFLAMAAIPLFGSVRVAMASPVE